MLHLQSFPEDLLEDVEIFPLNVDICVEIKSQRIVVVEGRAYADKVDEVDCPMVELDEMDDVGNNQGLGPCHVVEALKVLIFVRGVIIIFANVENVEQDNEEKSEEDQLCFQLHPISESF